MRSCGYSLLVLLAALPAAAQSPADTGAIRAAALDYVEGWYEENWEPRPW
jgi:hypothetical protein